MIILSTFHYQVIVNLQDSGNLMKERIDQYFKVIYEDFPVFIVDVIVQVRVVRGLGG